MRRSYDVIVIGGGHAGAEAAWAASRTGAETALITMRYDRIGLLSCNPAIGGLGKGQIVREIDALGGLMGLAIDRAGIQFRMLNRSKGPAVWAPRAQADRSLYPETLRSLLAESRSLDIVEGTVASIDVVDVLTNQSVKRVRGVILDDGRRMDAGSIIITTGTFLRGLMHCGEKQSTGGRVGEAGATTLSDALLSLGFELGRLKTGTPPRIHRDSIDYADCERQPGDQDPTPFSFMTDAIRQRQIACWITWTNAQVHDLIRANLHRAPMYSGQIQSTGPRYCPSIEDKVVRFADKDRHQVFLEPEGYDDERVYCNGISTSLPADVQDDIVRGIRGLKRSRIIQYGYAVEYDYVPTHQTTMTLETKRVAGLFLAGQINGTSGYEEAAGQGLVAGINAARHAAGNGEPFVLGRDQAYIGVMLDDLITRPPTEPYRMFTSRAEYRLLLRADNADERLTPIGRSAGLVDDARWNRFQTRRETVETVRGLCRHGNLGSISLATWIRRPDADVASLSQALRQQDEREFSTDVLSQVLIEAKYEGYVARQARQIERFRRLESMPIPTRVDYPSMPGLRNEARERLSAVSPRTLGQASRISGISPADITVLWVHLRRRRSST